MAGTIGTKGTLNKARFGISQGCRHIKINTRIMSDSKIESEIKIQSSRLSRASYACMNIKPIPIDSKPKKIINVANDAVT